jgi:hypothetical protein
VAAAVRAVVWMPLLLTLAVVPCCFIIRIFAQEIGHASPPFPWFFYFLSSNMYGFYIIIIYRPGFKKFLMARQQVN